MLNGEGLRVVLFLSGCEHACKGCHNPQTWDPDSGERFGMYEFFEIVDALAEDHVSGITFTGGDPLHEENLHVVKFLIEQIRNGFSNKTIWLYTGYTWDELTSTSFLIDPDENEIMKLRKDIIKMVDVLVDGKFDSALADINYPWAGSRNQKVINVQKSITERKIILYDSERP